MMFGISKCAKFGALCQIYQILPFSFILIELKSIVADTNEKRDSKSQFFAKNTN